MSALYEPMTPGTFIRARLRPAGYNQATLAEAIGVSGAYVNQLVHDKRTPSDPMILKIAAALTLTEDETQALRRLALARRADALRKRLGDLEAGLPAPET